MKYAMENIDTKKSSYHQSKWSVVFLYSFLRKDRVNGMKKLFISQPMRGKSDEDILTERKKAIESAEKAIGEPVEVIDSFFQEATVVPWKISGTFSRCRYRIFCERMARCKRM